MKLTIGKKFRHGSIGLAITAGVLLAVILLNVAFYALTDARMWFADMTSEGMYAVGEESLNYLQMTFDEVNRDRQAKNEEDVKVDIIFCAEPDLLKANEKMRYIYYTARLLEKHFPDTVEVTAVDVWSNPSVVAPYRTNSYSSIHQSNIIVASGSEFRVTGIDYYYTTNPNETEPWAYNGDKKFVQSIIAVTKAEAPICGITYNHGEPFATEEGKAQYSTLLNTIESAGFDLAFLDLSKDEIPEDCRLLLTFDPQTDFKAAFGQAEGSVSEIAKLDEFLAKTYSYMVFVDADTPVLPNLEELLEEWGISFDRYTDKADPEVILGNYRISSENAVDSEGLRVIGDLETEGLGGSVNKYILESGVSPKVVFGNAMSISYSSNYEKTFVLADETNGTGAYTYGSYFRNRNSRSMYDILRASEHSVAHSVKDGVVYTDENGAPIPVDTYGGYKLMTLTRETRLVGEGKGYTTVNDCSYVCAIGSTQFADNAILESNAYGNTDVLLEVLRLMGKEVVPVGILFKPMYKEAMTQASSSTGAVYYTSAGVTAWTVVLALIPTLALSISGVVILLKRRVKHG